MLKFIARRVATGIGVLSIVTAIVFTIFYKIGRAHV